MSASIFLRTHIRRLLSEDYGGGDVGGWYGDMGGWGGYGLGGMSGTPGSSASLYNIFIDPFVDVAKTAAAAVENVSNKSQTVLKILLEGIPKLLIPFVNGKYDEIFKEEEERNKKIRVKYAKVFAANDAAFKGDAQAIAFLFDPGKYLAYKMVKNMPAAAVKMVSMLAGGNKGVLGKIKGLGSQLGVKIDAPDPNQKVRRTPQDTRKVIDALYNVFGESVLREDSEDTGKSELLNQLVKMFSSPEFINAVNDSPVAKEMRQDAKNSVGKTLNELNKLAGELLGFSSLQDLKTLTGKDFTSKLQNLPEQEREGVEKLIISQLKTGIKEMLVKRTNGIVEAIPAEHPLKHAYSRLLDRVKSA